MNINIIILLGNFVQYPFTLIVASKFYLHTGAGLQGGGGGGEGGQFPTPQVFACMQTYLKIIKNKFL